MIRSTLVCGLMSLLGIPVLAHPHEGAGQASPSGGAAATGGTARGFVFDDANRNGRRDAGEPGIAGVRVSNGLDIVYTRADGAYELPVGDDTILFIIKPTDWMTPVNAANLPQFYYVHKPAGSPPLKFAGVAPTGPLPASVDFPLTRRPESSRFSALLFGDTQPRNQQEIDYMAHDVVDGLVGTDAALGVTLGDIVFDDLSLFGSLAATIGQIGVPWYNVLGNHDMNYDAADDAHSDETFERHFGPPYYAFDVARVHFVVLDNVMWIPAGNGAEAHYVSGLGERQLAWLVNDLKLVTPDHLVVLMMHIPLLETKETAAIFAELARFPFTLSLSAHQHYQEHAFFTSEQGWTGSQPHHHVTCATVCGSWWSGARDERGIPHATMSDGAPNGFNVITFDAAGYSIEFRAARRSSAEQMHIDAPQAVAAERAAATTVTVNVYAGNERTKVDLRFGESGEWRPMKQIRGEDPAFAALVAAEEKMQPPPDHKLPKPSKTSHLWQAALPAHPQKGTTSLYVRATDMFGRVHLARRQVRIE